MAFSGSIASGKTTISKQTASVLGWKYGSFGDFIRKEAARRGADPGARETLQEIGQELIEKGWEKFCWAVLKDAGWQKDESLALDGIRHQEALATIRTIVSPLPTYLIYVQVNEVSRTKRLLDKKINANELVRFEQHSTEQQVKNKLLDVSDLVINGAKPLDDSVKTVINWLSSTPGQ